ncbi:hypothetical protein [Aliamphritea hakodatensis]|uniref:hypothetical protein n=1 Tax=Aliamphritea hakodatensis TaxID=2895352 RepID=UPI0022FD4B53|nr:hypothetical protein [Aliamphritea hakodatensis]
MKLKFVKRKIQDKMFGNTQNTALGVQVAEMADARLGAMYMLAHTEIKKVPSFSLDPVGSFVVDTTPLSDLKTGCTYLLNKSEKGRKVVAKVSAVGDKVAAVKGKVDAKLDEFKQYIMRKLSEYFGVMVSKIKTVYGESLVGIEWIAEFGMWAASSFAKGLADLIPGWGYVQSLADGYVGVRTAILKSKDFIEQMWSGYGVQLLGGHPSIIANALARHSAKGIAGGVKDVLVAGVNIGLEAAGDAAGGAGTIVSAVTGVLSRVASLVEYIIQRCLINKTLKSAKKAWDNRNSPGSVVNDHKRFSEWFQRAVVTTPVVAALTMGSGFAAHPYKFLQLIQPNAGLVGSSEYAKGVHHIETLKKLSNKYIQEYNDNYSVAFHSTEGVIAARLKEMQENYSILHEYEYTRAPSSPTTPQSATSPQTTPNPAQQVAATTGTGSAGAAQASV